MHFTWASHAHHMGITCTPHGSSWVGPITWTPHRHPMHTTWVSHSHPCTPHGYHIHTTWASHAHHTGNTCTTHGHHIHTTWVSHAHYMGIKCIPPHGHLPAILSMWKKWVGCGIRGFLSICSIVTNWASVKLWVEIKEIKGILTDLIQRALSKSFKFEFIASVCSSPVSSAFP